MKKLVLALSLTLVLVGSVLANNYSNLVGTTSIKLLPERAVNAVRWTNGVAVAQGVLRMNQAGSIYMAVDSGTTGSTEPVHARGDASDGTVTWRRVIPGWRKSFTISVKAASATDYITVSIGEPAVLNVGTRVLDGQTLTLSGDEDRVFQDDIHVIGSAAGIVVSGHDR